MHRMTCAIEDAGFYIRDVFLWIYIDNQPKSMSLDHFVDKTNISEDAKKEIKEKLKNWKTPKLKSVYEPIIVAQKPPEKSLLENFIKYNTGLFMTSVRVGQNMFPSNILLLDETYTILDKYFLIKKDKKEKIAHPTVKPVELLEHLIKLSTVEGAIVLDPFLGSGSTALAAKKNNRHYIGIDINEEYVEIAKQRLNTLNKLL